MITAVHRNGTLDARVFGLPLLARLQRRLTRGKRLKRSPRACTTLPSTVGGGRIDKSASPCRACEHPRIPAVRSERSADTVLQALVGRLVPLRVHYTWPTDALKAERQRSIDQPPIHSVGIRMPSRRTRRPTGHHHAWWPRACTHPSPHREGLLHGDSLSESPCMASSNSRHVNGTMNHEP